MIDKKISLRDCTGCTACESICPVKCISMDEDREGFLYPNVNYDQCIRCGKCVKVCPILHDVQLSSSTRVFGTQNIDVKDRYSSSSGAFFSVLAHYVLSQGGVVFGAGFDSDFEVIHKCVTSLEEWNKSDLMGSKYVQSRLGSTFLAVKKYLNEKRLTLFVGTPCQVAGLYSYLGSLPNELVLVDLACYGVPSPKVYRKYIDYCRYRYNDEVKSINFRDKSYGFSSPNLRITFRREKYREQNWIIKSYQRSFFSGINVRPSCYSCHFKTVERVSDFTLADCWSIGMFSKELDDDIGTTAVYIHSSKATDIFHKVKSMLKYEELDVEKCIATDGKKMVSCVQVHPRRESFYNDLDSLPYNKLVKRYLPQTLRNRVANIVKPLLKKTGFVKLIKKIK